MLVVCNLTPVPRYNVVAGLPEPGYWRERLNSDAETYGGSGVGNLGGVTAGPDPAGPAALLGCAARSPHSAASSSVVDERPADRRHPGAPEGTIHRVGATGPAGESWCSTGTDLASSPPVPAGYHQVRARRSAPVAGTGITLIGASPHGRPRVTIATRRRARAVGRSSTSAALWQDQDYQPRAVARRTSSARSISAPSPPTARSTPPLSGSTTWSRWASVRWRSCRSPNSRAGGTGATTASSLCRAALLRRPGRTAALGRCLPPAWPGRHPRCRLQPPRARGQRPRCVRALLHRPLPHALGPGRQF